MASIEMRVDLSTLVDAVIAGNAEQIVAAARAHLRAGESADVLLGRIGLIAAHGDRDGNAVLTLAAAAMLSRYVHVIPPPVNGSIERPIPNFPDESNQSHERELPLFAQALLAVAPVVRAGNEAPVSYPKPLYPSGLPEGKNVNAAMHEAIYTNDTQLAERLLLGLYGTGADYRTMQVRTYDGISATFQDAGHPLMLAVRGFQLLGTVEWGDRAPVILHWLAPHLPLRPSANEPEWVEALRSFTADPSRSVASVRTRLSPPKESNALPLRQLVLSEASTTQVCQGVYDALLKGEASPRAISSVIALAASDVLRKVGDGDRDLFVRAAHGLLFAAAARQVFQQVQDVEVLALLFTSAAYVNALNKEVTAQPQGEPAQPQASTATIGGGLIAPSQLEALKAQLDAQDLNGALTTARRYLNLGHDPRGLFGTIALSAAQVDAAADQGHTLQIVQAAAETYLAWPAQLAETTIEGLLYAALRAAVFGTRDNIVSRL